MPRTRLLAAVLAVALAACSGDTTAPETVVTVTVTPGSGTLDAVGASVQFQASPRDASGQLITGKTVAWTSSDNGVATVSSTGLATAVAVGAATITATVDGVKGSSALTVSEPAMPCTAPKTVTLGVGASQTFEGTDCLVLPAGVAGDRYRVVVNRPAATGSASDVFNTTLKVVGLGVAQTAPPVPAPSRVTVSSPTVSGLSRAAVEKARRVADATERFHAWLRSHDAALAREAGYHLLPARPGGTLKRVVARATSPATMRFDTSAGTTCAEATDSQRTGVLIFESDELAIYQDSTQNTTKPVSVALAQKMTSYFSAYVKDMIPKYWGEVSDIDGNGKIIVFASPRASGDVAAFVWSGDFYPAESCAASNEKELIYFNVDQILNLEGDNPSYQALATLAHETKHVVSLYNRIAASRRTVSDQFHPTWMEEGTAEISGEVSSRLAWAATGGPALNQRISGQSFKATGSITEANYYVAINLARTAWYLSSQPNGLVISPTGAAQGHSVYGSGWLFHRWLGDAYAGAASAPMADAAFFKALTDSLAQGGTAGLTNKTGVSFLDLYGQFVNAVALHATPAPEPDRHFTTYDFPTAAEIFCTPNPLGVFPWPVTTSGTEGDCDVTPRVVEVSNPSATFATANYAGRIGASGMRIHDFVSNGTGTGAQISLDTGGRSAKMTVVRLR